MINAKCQSPYGRGSLHRFWLSCFDPMNYLLSTLFPIFRLWTMMTLITETLLAHLLYVFYTLSCNWCIGRYWDVLYTTYVLFWSILFRSCESSLRSKIYVYIYILNESRIQALVSGRGKGLQSSRTILEIFMLLRRHGNAVIRKPRERRSPCGLSNDSHNE